MLRETISISIIWFFNLMTEGYHEMQWLLTAVEFIWFQGMVFDLEEGSTLYIDLAKSNSRSKRTRIGLLTNHIATLN